VIPNPTPLLTVMFRMYNYYSKIILLYIRTVVVGVELMSGELTMSGCTVQSVHVHTVNYIFLKKYLMHPASIPR
jgi:hypothetical protein